MDRPTVPGLGGGDCCSGASTQPPPAPGGAPTAAGGCPFSSLLLPPPSDPPSDDDEATALALLLAGPTAEERSHLASELLLDGCAGAVRRAVEAGAVRPDATNRHGAPLVTVAASCGAVAVLRLLVLENGVDAKPGRARSGSRHYTWRSRWGKRRPRCF